MGTDEERAERQEAPIDQAEDKDDIDDLGADQAEILEAEQLDMARDIFRKGISEGIPPRKQALDMVGRVTPGGKALVII